jgi:hypothetical protein
MTGTFTPTTEPERPLAFDALGLLVTDEKALRAWIARREHDGKPIRNAMDALMEIGALRRDARWDMDTLLREIGCTKRSLAQLNALEDQAIGECLEFFQWLHELLEVVPPETNIKRAVISGASELYGAAPSLATCRESMNAPIEDGRRWTACDLIECGEIDAAFRFARRFLPGAMGDRARLIADENPAAALPVVHISTETLDALARHQRGRVTDVLGKERVARLEQHLSDCGSCLRKYERSEEATGLREATPIRFRAVGDS